LAAITGELLGISGGVTGFLALVALGSVLDLFPGPVTAISLASARWRK
jgi:hypothetical protein